MGRCAVGALFALLVAVAGCSSDEVGASADPVASTPVGGSVAVVPEDETAEEFIRRWFGMQQALYDTGDSTEYLSVAPRCVDCRRAADLISGFYRDGGSVNYGGDRVASVRLSNKEHGVYRVSVDIGPTRYRERAGGPEKRLPGGRETYAVTLAGDRGDWKVEHISRIDP